MVVRVFVALPEIREPRHRVLIPHDALDHGRDRFLHLVVTQRATLSDAVDDEFHAVDSSVVGGQCFRRLLLRFDDVFVDLIAQLGRFLLVLRDLIATLDPRCFDLGYVERALLDVDRDVAAGISQLIENLIVPDLESLEEERGVEPRAIELGDIHAVLQVFGQQL